MRKLPFSAQKVEKVQKIEKTAKEGPQIFFLRIGRYGDKEI
jgi:hypothetical protein